MRSPATFRRNAAATGLVLTAVLSLVSVVLQPEFPPGFTDRLAAIDAAGGRGVVSAMAFALAQLPFIAAVLGVAHLLRERAPVLSGLAATLGVLGAFGHAVFSGVSLVYVTMAADPQHRTTYAQLMKQVEGSPTMLFAAMGLLGTVLGVVLLGVALWRSRLVARWIPVTLWAFVVVEFVGSNLSTYASALSGALFLTAFVALAVWVARTPRSAWEMVSAGVDVPAAPPRVAAEPSGSSRQ